MKHKKLYATLAASLLLLPLASCNNEEKPAEPKPTSIKQAEPSKTAEEAQKIIEEYFTAEDKSAANGWEDHSHNDKYLVPELAKKANEQDEKYHATGQKIINPGKASNWTPVEVSQTKTVIEFCNLHKDIEVINKDGKKIGKPNNYVDGESVGRFTLVRENVDQQWKISEMGYYPEDVTCADHFKK